MNLFTLSTLSLLVSALVQLISIQFNSNSMVLSNMEPDPLEYSEGQGALPLTSTLEISTGGDSLIAATVWISSNLRSCEDSLNVVEHPEILAAYDANSGTLSLLGVATAAEYQAVLRSVTYTNTNLTNPFQVPRTIEFQVHGFTENSNSVSRIVHVTGVLNGPFHLPYTESFETDGNGTRYDANSFSDGASNYFERLQSGSGQIANDPANIDGNWFWAGEDVSDVIGVPADNCQNGNPHPSGHGHLRLANLLAYGYANLEVTIYLAVGQDERFGPSDGLLIQYAFDADIDSENYTTIGAFYGDDPDTDSGSMRQDLNLNGEADPGAPVLNFTLTDFSFSIPDAGSLLSVRVVMTQNAGNEELIFDHIRVNGLLQCFAEAGQMTGTSQSVCPGDTVTVGVQNQQTDPAYIQTYLLADPAGNIVDIQASGSFILPVGTFTVYSYNYHGAGSAPTNPATLASINCLDDCCDLVAANFQVTAADSEAPEAICLGTLTVELNASGTATLQPDDLDAGSTDNCGITSRSLSQSSFDCSHVGTQSIILTVVDAQGNQDTCSTQVLISDAVPPALLCQNTNLVLDETGNASITAAQLLESAFDACGIVSFDLTISNFSCEHIGSNTVVVSAYDVNGNSWGCTATVTVADQAAPIVFCKNLTVFLDSLGQVSITQSDINSGIQEACEIDSIWITRNLFTCDDLGPNSVFLHVTDLSGNEGLCHSIVTVLDTIQPFIACPANQIITADANCQGLLPDYTGAATELYDNCPAGLLITQLPAAGSALSYPATQVVLTATDEAGLSAFCLFLVTMQDQTPPNAVCQNATIYLDAEGLAVLMPSDLDGGSNDACGIDTISVSQIAFTCAHTGPNLLTLTIVDLEGNSATCEAEVTVLDTVPPLALCQNITISLNDEGAYFLNPDLVNAGSSDACGIDQTSVSPQTFDCSSIGLQTVTLTVTDYFGNTSQCTAEVLVQDLTAPTALCQNITIQLNANGDASINGLDVDNGSSDACGIGPLAVTPSSFTCASVGPNEVVLTVTDLNGNLSTCTATVTIVDQTPPSAQCQDVTITLNAAGTFTLLDAAVNAGSTDACGLGGFFLSQTVFNCEHLGPNPVVLTVTDIHNNSATCTATVTVEDSILPLAQCQNITVTMNANGQVSLAPDAVDGGSTDNCEALNFSLSKADFDCNHVGTNPVTMTVTDLGGNSASCNALVSVIASAACTAPEIVNFGGPTIADPCLCLSNGQFAEEVMVMAGNGQNWTIVSTTILHPVTLLPFPAGTPLIETVQIPGESIYTLAGVHLDGQGYSITVSSPFYPGVQLSISNTCYYPNPQIIGLSGPYCINTPPITLVGEVGGVALVSEGFTINGNPATVFAPGQLGIGTHTVVYTVDAGTAGSNDPSNPGCVASASQTLQVVVTPGAMACNSLLNISVDENCEAFITPDMILEGSNYLCYDDYGVTVKFGINTIPNPIPGTYIGQQLTVTITHLPSGNSCSSTVILSDFLPPSFDCPTTPAVIACTAAVSSVPPPPAFDNCTPVSVVLVDEFVDDNDPCDDGKVRIHRIWRAIDTYGNESGTCLQVIEIERPDEVDFPNDITWECNQENAYPGILAASPLHPSILAAQVGIQPYNATGITSASVLGNTGSGTPLGIDGPYCNYAYSHSDLIVPGCGNSFDIVRTWTVIDWCTGLLVTSNSAGEDNIQLIRVVDVTPPQIVRAPFDLSASIPGDPIHNPCTSEGLLLPPVVTDNCNTTTVRIFTPVGEAVYVNGQNGSNGGFVPAPGLPLGVHLILYQAEDACSNIAELYVPVEVVDDISPTAICKQITTVSLSSNGLATVPAIIFDNGSFDNCCLDYLEVRRQDGDCNGNFDDFGPNVTFCCSDIGSNPIMVVLRIVDCYGNFNQCIVQVNVEDKLPPVTVSCPGPQTITCDEYLNEFAAELSFGNYAVLNPFGAPIFFDNCSFTVNQMVQLNINSCQEGTITRFWTAADPFGNSAATCTQVITVQHISNWVVQFPADIIMECSNGGLPPFGEPQVFFDQCEMIGISFSDQTFYTVPDACYMIVRTWTAVNWCLFSQFGFNAYLELSEAQVGQDFNGDGQINNRTFKDGVNNAGIPDGYIVYQQVIKVVDNDAPVFQVDDLEVCILGTGCSTTVNLPVPSVSDCNPSSSISITSNLPNPVGGNPYQYLNVPPGTYTATYAVSDLCGNTAYQTISIDVTDCKKPTPFCVNGLVVEIMQTGMIDISVSSFNAGSFDNCSGALLFSYSANVSDTVRTFDCDLLGFQPIEMWVTDAAGNQDFCTTFVNIQDNMEVCTSMPMIAGRVHTEMDLNVANVMVDVNGGAFYQMTGTDGMYGLGLPFLGDYTVVPSHDANHVNGVTTLDLLFIKQHILGVNLLNSPYKMIAADVNNSKHITTLDMLVAQQLILGMIDHFPNNSSWRFVSADYTFPNPANPWQQVFPEFVSYNNLSADMLDVNFIAVKIGDVNNSVQSNAGAPAEDRNLVEGLVLEAPNRMLEPGETVRIPFATSAAGALGYQFTLEFDTDALEFANLEEGLAGRDQFGLRFLPQGHITTNWHADAPQTLHPDEPLFALYFTAKKSVALESVLRIASNGRTAAESYLADMKPRSLSLEFRSEAGASSGDFALYQNVPNPFVGSTVVGFRLPAASQVALRVSDVNGRLLRLVEGYFEAGYHEVELRELPASGLLFYRLDAGGFSATRRMVANP